MAIELLPDQIPSKEEIEEATYLPAIFPEELRIWQEGRAYAHLMDKGYKQAKIAAAIGRSQTCVSRAAGIFRGLAPSAHETLCRLGTAAPNGLKISKIAALRTPDGEPDEERQLAALQKFLGKTVSVQGAERIIVVRFRKLREMRLTHAGAPIVAAVVAYLSGDHDTLTLPEISWPSTTATPPARRRPTSRSRSTS